jgi:hypothetical protein
MDDTILAKRKIVMYYNGRMRLLKRRGVTGIGCLAGLLVFAGTATASKRREAPAKARKSAALVWQRYQNKEIGFQMQVPKTWIPLSSEKAVGFRSRRDGSGGAVGVLKNDQGKLTIEKAAKQQYKKQNRPADWTQTPSTVNGRRALKIMISPDPRRQKKMVQYYVEVPDGYFMIQCIAPRKAWPQYAPLFAKIISSFEILP